MVAHGLMPESGNRALRMCVFKFIFIKIIKNKEEYSSSTDSCRVLKNRAA